MLRVFVFFSFLWSLCVSFYLLLWINNLPCQQRKLRWDMWGEFAYHFNFPRNFRAGIYCVCVAKYYRAESAQLHCTGHRFRFLFYLGKERKSSDANLHMKKSMNLPWPSRRGVVQPCYKLTRGGIMASTGSGVHVNSTASNLPDNQIPSYHI